MLPVPQSSLAQPKAPYVFHPLTRTEECNERKPDDNLVADVTNTTHAYTNDGTQENMKIGQENTVGNGMGAT